MSKRKPTPPANNSTPQLPDMRVTEIVALKIENIQFRFAELQRAQADLQSQALQILQPEMAARGISSETHGYSPSDRMFMPLPPKS